MNTAITDYEEFANSRAERDFYIAPAIMEGYKPRTEAKSERLMSIMVSLKPNMPHSIYTLKMLTKGILGFFAVYGVAGIVETISNLF